MKKWIILIFFLFFSLHFQSCKKKEEIPTAEEILIKAPWIGDKEIIIDDNGNADTLQISQKSLVFKTTFRYEYYLMGILYDEGNWSYINEDDKLIFDSDNNGKFEVEVIELEASKLSYTYREDVNNDGQTEKIVEEYIRN